MIQAAGFLLILSGDWQVEAVSANFGQFQAHQPADLLGRPASDILADDAVHALRNRLALLRDPRGIEHLLACRLLHDERRYDVAIHLSGDAIVIEAEPASDRAYGDITATVRGMFARADTKTSLSDFLGEAARQVRALSGFDRVEIIRLHDDGSSDVVAEHSRSPLPPGQADDGDFLTHEDRLAVGRCQLHLDGDIDSATVPLLVNDGCVLPDLSRAMLRPLSEARHDRLRAIGARASMTLALIVGGSLWGVIDCAHHHPRRPSFERRSIADLFVQLLVLRIEIFELKAVVETH